MILAPVFFLVLVGMIRGGIFGPGGSGKSTLAKYMSREYWRLHNMRSLVFSPMDPHGWGKQAMVFRDEKAFWKAVRATRECLIIPDDASVTIRRDADLVDIFTVMRHQHHKLLVVGHTASDLLPSMRKQIDTIFLFWQDEEEAEKWEKLFPRSRLGFAFQLQQHEFLRHKRFSSTERNKLTL